jgi:putative FmdB family regulatory protein
MPIFEYLCRQCGEMIEIIRKNITDEVPCPRCGGPAERTVSVFSGKTTTGSGEGGGCAPTGGFG